MTTTAINCITIECDTCNEDAGDDETGPTWHFTDIAAAQKLLEGWRISAAEQVCEKCVAIETCAREGHEWGRWGARWLDASRSDRFCQRDYCYARESKES